MAQNYRQMDKSVKMDQKGRIIRPDPPADRGQRSRPLSVIGVIMGPSFYDLPETCCKVLGGPDVVFQSAFFYYDSVFCCNLNVKQLQRILFLMTSLPVWEQYLYLFRNKT